MCVEPNGEMAPLPHHFDLEETIAQIDSIRQPEVQQKPTQRLQRIENLPHQYQGMVNTL